MPTAMAPASALRAARCSACSLSALRLFVGNIAESPARTTAATLIGARRLAPSSAATFSTFRPTARLLGNPAIEEQYSNENATTEPTPESSASDTPWYLQVDAPKHPTLLHEPSPLPKIPEDSPTLMEPLVKFAADELGMDDLSLLDLREMDPAPALGPDLLMLFGTARSERHLHVSADRLVRWLRGRGVTASADGLLGRNELKIKLRRIARKAKLLGNSGVPRGGDDGISTGWICVNLGLIGGSTQEMEMVDDQGRPTGFGVPQTGTTVVFQMMTESRRQDLDLESLWGYDLSMAKEWLKQIQFSGVTLTRGICLDLVQSIYATPATSDAAVRDQSALAMQIVDTMYARGQKVFDHDVIVKVIEGLAARLLGQFEHLLAQADLPCPSEDHLVRLMRTYASQGKWERFWDVWGIPPRYRQARSSRLYAHLYTIFAEDGHRTRCIGALRRTYYEMALEEPPVLLNGTIRRGLRDCIRRADPGAEQVAKMVATMSLQESKISKNREFVAMLVQAGIV
ncbi:ATPase synthesis protein 25 mitochondrial [Collariella sp. IMI 366227]|nr:ATPase synthesis protein 25 mitochondrial [Collariella sp. IMI 366227]